MSEEFKSWSMSIRFLIALVSTGLLMTALPAKAETGENGGSDDAIKLTWDNGIVITRKGLDWFRDLIVTPFASIYEALNPPADSVIDANTEIDFTETPTSFVATFDGFGAVKRSEENISVEIKGKYWRFNGDINVYNEVDLEGTSDDADKIELTSATLRHTYGPPDYSGDHGPADSLRPNVFYVANQSGLEPGGTGNYSSAETTGLATHSPHQDKLVYSLFDGITVSRDATSLFGEEDWHITGFTYQVRAEHVPGPLPLFGVAGAFAFSRRIRKRIKVSPG